MYCTLEQIIKPSSPISSYFEKDTVGTRALKNRANFLIRNTMTGLKKTEETRTPSEVEALDTVFTGLKLANEKRVKEGKDEFTLPDAEKWMLSYDKLVTIMINTQDPSYYRCTSQVNQQALKGLTKEWKSYFKSNKDWQANPEKYKAKPKIPGYIRTNATTAHYTNQAAKPVKKDGKLYLRFSGYGLYCVGNEDLVNGRIIKVEVQPYYGKYRLLITYESDYTEQEVPEHPERIAGIDLGIDNLITLVTNTGANPLIINGKYIKSVNQWFNKRKAILTGDLTKGSISSESEKHSKQLDSLSLKRNLIFNDFFYKTAHYVFRFCQENQIEVIVIGHNKDQKQNINIGHKNNQAFVSIPYTKLIEIMQTVSCKYEIPVIVREESYTSKASVLDMDEIPTYCENDKEKKFSGNRKCRGLYEAKDGRTLNADVNGAANILRKEFPYAFDEKDLDFLTGFVKCIGKDELYPQHKKNNKSNSSSQNLKNRKSKTSALHHKKRKRERDSLERRFKKRKHRLKETQQSA